jgi:hypothetical protein
VAVSTFPGSGPEFDADADAGDDDDDGDDGMLERAADVDAEASRRCCSRDKARVWPCVLASPFTGKGKPDGGGARYTCMWLPGNATEGGNREVGFAFGAPRETMCSGNISARLGSTTGRGSYE